MKIYVYYEDKNDKTYLDVPDEECTVMIREDYERRLSEAQDGEEVLPRTMQQIMDEDYNNPTFNSNQRETRRHVHIEACDPDGKHFSDGEDPERRLIREEEVETLRKAIAKLEPGQQELLRRLFWEGERKTDIAEEDGVSQSAITGRLKKIYRKMKKFLD